LEHSNPGRTRSSLESQLEPFWSSPAGSA
jgi:hypothetical protein